MRCIANISTRGNVQTGDNVMIGGFINAGKDSIKVLVRGNRTIDTSECGARLGNCWREGTVLDPFA